MLCHFCLLSNLLSCPSDNALQVRGNWVLVITIEYSQMAGNIPS